jgi:uncharacterized protein involved in exopolysaccharide biosynthesis
VPLTEKREERTADSFLSPQQHWNNWTSALERLWSKRRIVACWIGVGILASIPLCLFIPKYESTVQIMPPDSAGSGLAALALPTLSKMPGLAGLASELLGSRNSTALFMKVLESRTVQDDLITRFDLRSHYKKKYWSDTRDKLQSRTTVSEDKKSGVLTLEVKDRDPQFAQALAAAYADELDKVVTKVSTSAAGRERRFIEQRLAEERQVLDDAERQFSRFASKTMTLDIPQQTRVTVEAAAKLQGELIAARTELEGLQQIYAPENSRIKVAQARVGELERALGRINAGPVETGGAQDPTNPYPSVKNLPVLGVQWVDLYRNTKLHETVFELLTQQYELAKIQEAREIPTVKVLDSASLPEKRHPRPWVVILFGVMGGCILGCLHVWCRDSWEGWNSQDPRRRFLERTYGGIVGKLRLKRKSEFSAGNGIPGQQDEADVEREYSNRRA